MTSAPPSTGPTRTDAGADEPLGRSGWHPDPWRRHALRFYDGWLWTEHVADGGVAGLDSTPVAEGERSRPRPERAVPPDDAVGARVLPDGAGAPVAEASVVAEPLLLVGEPDDAGARSLLRPDDRLAGRVVPGPARRTTRLGRLLVTDPSTRVTRLRVEDAAGGELIRLDRPWRRTATVVDVTGPGGPLGTVVAERVVQGLHARVVTAEGRTLGLLDRADEATGALAVADGAELRARLTPVWDVPGRRRHLPPGVLLLDRRPPSGEEPDPLTAALLLGALLAPALLLPPT